MTTARRVITNEVSGPAPPAWVPKVFLLGNDTQPAVTIGIIEDGEFLNVLGGSRYVGGGSYPRAEITQMAPDSVSPLDVSRVSPRVAWAYTYDFAKSATHVFYLATVYDSYCIRRNLKGSYTADVISGVININDPVYSLAYVSSLNQVFSISQSGRIRKYSHDLVLLEQKTLQGKQGGFDFDALQIQHCVSDSDHLYATFQGTRAGDCYRGVVKIDSSLTAVATYAYKETGRGIGYQLRAFYDAAEGAIVFDSNASVAFTGLAAFKIATSDMSLTAAAVWFSSTEGYAGYTPMRVGGDYFFITRYGGYRTPLAKISVDFTAIQSLRFERVVGSASSDPGKAPLANAGGNIAVCFAVNPEDGFHITSPVVYVLDTDLSTYYGDIPPCVPALQLLDGGYSLTPITPLAGTAITWTITADTLPSEAAAPTEITGTVPLTSCDYS